MFKTNMPTTKSIMSSGGLLALLALASLALLVSTANTSEIEPEVNHENHKTAAAAAASSLESQAEKQDNVLEMSSGAKGFAPQAGDSRQRSGRMYQQTGGQQPIDSYAAAYAAANSASDPSAAGHVTQQASSDASAYSSFGESLPGSTAAAVAAVANAERTSAGLGSGSSVRQLASSADYSPSASYFASYMSPSSNEASYSGQPVAGSGYHTPSSHMQQQQHHYYKSPASTLPLGYPTNTGYERNAFPAMSSYYDRMANSPHYMAAASTPLWASSSSSFPSSNTGGLMSSASHALSHWTNGFSIGEIICGIVALAIGAVILGAPFFLIYLALMGNFSGSGTLSLTNPTSPAAAGGAAAPANGRRKRLAVFEAMNLTGEQARRHPDFATVAESVVKQISPFVDLEQVSKTFKQLVSSLDKYSPPKSSFSAKAKSS